MVSRGRAIPCTDWRARWLPGRLLCFLLLALALHDAYPAKVIRVAERSAETTFDPQYESDAVTNGMLDHIFEAPLEYDYLARPAKLRPRTLVELPAISGGGKVFTLRVKPGIRFADHPLWMGKPRELVAADYVYSIKRLLDPKVRSNWLFLVDHKLEGGNALRDEAKLRGRFDYDRAIPGLKVLDRYTFEIRLIEADYKFPLILALPALGAVARELVEHHGSDFGAHPVGTGPYVLAEWQRGARVVLKRNPLFREVLWDATPGPSAADQAIYRRMRGKRVPQADAIEISIIPEDQPRWLSFLNGDHDYITNVPNEYASFALPGGRLSPALARQGYTSTPDEVAWVTYTTFNMQDRVLGGFAPERVALRRALAHAYRIDDEIMLFYKGQAVKANSPLTPGVAGYDPGLANAIDYSPAKAKALLDMYGYVDRDGDGYRELPDGQPLVLDHALEPTHRHRQLGEIWKRSLDAVGINVQFRTVQPIPELRKRAKAGQIQMFTYGWIADYPDGENFLQLFTTGSIGQVNYAMFSHPEYDALYQRIRSMPHTPERDALYARMVRMIFAYSPWRVNSYMRPTILMQPWLHGYRKHPFMQEPWRYLDVSERRR
jgi:ABC-type transport system substrate-binding protein